MAHNTQRNTTQHNKITTLDFALFLSNAEILSAFVRVRASTKLVKAVDRRKKSKRSLLFRCLPRAVPHRTLCAIIISRFYVLRPVCTCVPPPPQGKQWHVATVRHSPQHNQNSTNGVTPSRAPRNICASHANPKCSYVLQPTHRHI